MVRSAVGTLTRAFRNAAGDVPVPFTSARQSGLSQFGGGGYSNTAALLAATKESGTLYATVRRTSNATAQCKWGLYRRSGTQQVNYDDDSNREQIFQHAALDVMNSPNQHMTWHSLCEGAQQHGDIVGEQVIVFGNVGQRAPGRPAGFIPSSMWYVRPDRVKPVTSPSEYIIGYVYTGPDGEQVPLETWQVMRIIVPDPEDQFRGLGPVRSILTTLDAEKYSAQWNRNFFINSAEPGGIIQFGDNVNRIKLDDTEWDEFQQRWRDSHRGVSNAHRVAILENGATWQANNVTHHDMEFALLRTVSRDVVLEAFGMPGSMIGISEHVNKANAQTGEVTFARWIVKERLDRWKDALNKFYLPLFGNTAKGLEFDYMDPTPTDDAAETSASYVRIQSAVLAVGAGWDAAQSLETFGLPPMDWTKPATPAPPIHMLPGGPMPPGNDPAKPEGQPNENDDSNLVNA